MGVKFRFARGKKKKLLPPPEEEEQGEETGGEEENGENLEQLAESATTLAQPIKTQAPLPPLPPPESVPPRLRLAQVQATAESHPVAQTPPPPARRLPQVTVRRPVQTARHDLPLRAQRPIYSRAICIITKDVNGIRVVLKSLVVPTVKDFFRVGEHMFHVDISRTFMVSAKGPYLMYDIDITEPLEKNAVEEKIEHKPILLGDNVHYSPHVNLLLQGKVIEQALKSIGEAGGFNMMMWILFAVGAIMGLFIGLYLAPLVHIGTVTTTTTTTTTAATMSPLWRLFRL